MGSYDSSWVLSLESQIALLYALFFYLKTIIAIMIIISDKTYKKALGQVQIPQDPDK